MSKIEINYDAIKNAKGFEYADNREGVSCRLVPIEEAREQDKKVKFFDLIRDKRVDVGFLMSCKTVEEYNSKETNYMAYYLTEEEFKSLKEVLA